MGLDTSHDAWHGAYGAFSRWRNKLAEVAGYELEEYGDYGIKGVKPPTGWTEQTLFSRAHVDGYWEEPPSDPLLILLAHSDCDGWIFPHHAGPLADRLAELLPLLPDEVGGGHVRHWHETTQRFIDGLRKAADEGEVVVFH